MEETEEETEFETNQPEEERRYQDKLNYTGYLLALITNVLNSVDNFNRSGVKQVESVLAYLTPDLRGEVMPDVNKAKKQLNRQINKYARTHFDPDKCSNARITLSQKYAKKVVQIVIEVLHDRGMLLTEERKLDEGGY